MKEWTLYLSRVLPECKLVPRPLAVEAIRDAAIELCERSGVWRENQEEEYDIGGEEGNYEFRVDAQTVVHRVDVAKITNGPKLEIRTFGWVDDNYPDWRSGTVTGQPTLLTQIGPEEFWLVPFPASEGLLSLQVRLKPKRDSDGGPDFLLEEHVETIAAGAKARLMGMEGQPWTNDKGVLKYQARFDMATGKAKTRAAKAFGRGISRVRPQFF